MPVGHSSWSRAFSNASAEQRRAGTADRPLLRGPPARPVELRQALQTQAIHLRVGDTGLAVSLHTTDAELGLRPDLLAPSPELAACMTAAGFRHDSASSVGIRGPTAATSFARAGMKPRPAIGSISVEERDIVKAYGT